MHAARGGLGESPEQPQHAPLVQRNGCPAPNRETEVRSLWGVLPRRNRPPALRHTRTHTQEPRHATTPYNLAASGQRVNRSHRHSDTHSEWVDYGGSLAWVEPTAGLAAR